MSRNAIKIPAFNSVAVGQPATSNLGVGPGYTYNHIFGRLLKNGALVTLANLGTDVDEIRLEADGDVIRRVTPALLLSFLQSKNLTGMLTNGAAADIQSFILPFADPSRADVVGQEATRLGTVGVKQLVLVVVLKDPGGAPVYTLSGTADIVTDEPKSLSVYERWAIDSFDIINGTKPFNTLAVDDDILGHVLQSNAITAATVTIEGNNGNGVKVFDLTKADAEAFLRTNVPGAVTANFFPLFADLSSQITDRWLTAARDPANPQKVISRIGNVIVELTATGAATIKSLRRTLRY